ncbi:MAG TPA: GAF domain-containing protein [Verrucomicrobiae bacterium]|nr:GAF domain-containing protein [Verrucomicrobiae bacterium]
MKTPDSTVPGPKPLRDPRLTAINFVSDAVNRTLDLKEVADNALDSVLAVMKMDAGAVYIWHDTDQCLQMFASRGLDEKFTRTVSVLPRGTEAIDAVLNGEARVIEDLASRPGDMASNVTRAGFHSGALVPIRAHGYVVGALALGTYHRREFAEPDVDLIEAVSNQIGNAMVHAQLQSELRASEEQYRALVENSDDAIYITDSTGRLRFANSAFPRILGYSASEVAHADLISHVHEEDVGTVREAVDGLLRGEAIRNLEYRFCRKDGVWIHLQCSGSVFSREGDHVMAVQFVVRDVTQARQRQQQLVRRNRQLAALTTLANVANSSLNIDEIARDTLEVAMQSTGMSGGAIHLAEPNQQVLRLYLQTGLPDDFVDGLRQLKWGELVPGYVAASGQPAVAEDLDIWTPAGPSLAVRYGFRSTIVVPVKTKGEILGTLGLLSRQRHEFTPEVVEMVTAMGNQLGIAVANARLYKEQLQENEKLAALVDISTGNAQQLELERLLQRILERAALLLRADSAYITRYNKATEQVEFVAASGGFERLMGTSYPADEGLFGQIRATRQGRIFGRDEVRAYGYSALVREPDARSAVVVPLISRNELIGSLGLARHGEHAVEFTSASLELIEAFASRAAVAIDNAQLFEDLERKNELLQLLIEEAHHRIKNNLQMVSGLLQLGSDSDQLDASKNFLQTAMARIQAIAQVHNLLSEEMAEKVDASALITAIVHMLAGSATRSTGQPEVAVDLERVWLGAEQAVALALIVNELVSNAFLHGRASPGQPLRVRIECRCRDEYVELVVADNGGGIAPGKDGRESGGKGMNIVSRLAQVNLRGQLQIDTRDGGVRAALRFEIVPYGPGPGARVRPTLAAREA